MSNAIVPRLTIADICYGVVSYGATLIRLGIAAAVAVIIIGDVNWNKVVVSLGIVLVMVLDYLDGILFSRSVMNNDKSWRIRRRIVDSVIDRIVIQAVCIPLVLIYNSFQPFFLIILAREVFMSTFLTRVFARNILIYPSKVSRLSMIMIGITVIAYALNYSNVAVLAATLMIGFSLISFQEYKKRLSNNQGDSIIELREIQ
ncbi:MAG: hypothetical protein ACHQQQ_02530 [Bacteroidota bacterium]